MEDQVNRLVAKVWDKLQQTPPDQRLSEYDGMTWDEGDKKATKKGGRLIASHLHLMDDAVAGCFQPGFHCRQAYSVFTTFCRVYARSLREILFLPLLRRLTRLQ